MADGSIIIDSRIDSSEFRKGLQEMWQASMRFTADLAGDFKLISGAYGELSKTLSATSQHIKSVKVDGSLRDVVNSVKTSMEEISRTLQKGNVVRVDDRPFSASMENMRGESRKFRQQVKEDFDEVGISGKELAEIIKKGIAAFAGYKAVKMGQGMVLDAARYETLGIVVEQAGKNAGYSAEQMHKYQEELEKTGISAIETRQALASMATAGIDLEFASKLARAAQDLAVVAGTDSSEAFQRLIDGVERGNTLTLKTLGLNMDFEQSYQSLAHTIGKTSSQLTEQDKVHIRQIAVLQEATKYQGIYEASMMTAGKQLGSLTRHLSDLGKNIGTLGLDALAYGVSDVTKQIEGVNEQFKVWAEDGSLDKIRRNVGEGFKAVADNVHVAAFAFGAYTVAQKAVSSELGKQSIDLTKQHGLWATLKAQIMGTTAALKLDTQTHSESFATRKADLEGYLKDVGKQIALQKKALNEVHMDYLRGDVGALQSLQEGKKELVGLEQRQIAIRAALKAVTDQETASTIVSSTATSKKAAALHLLNRAQLAATGALTAFGRGLGWVVNIMGGPVVAGVTVLAAALAYFSGRQSEGQKITEKYSATIAGLGGSAEEAATALGDLEKRVASMTKEQAKFVLVDTKKDIAVVKRELEDFIGTASGFSGTIQAILGGELMGQTPFAGAIVALREGRISAEEFRKSVYAIGEEMNEAGRSKATSLIELSKKWETLTTLLDLLTTKTTKTAEATDKAGQSAATAAKHYAKLEDAVKKVAELEGLMDKLILNPKEFNAKELVKDLDDYRGAIAKLVQEGKTAEAELASLRLTFLEAGAKAGGFESLKSYAEARKKLSDDVKRLEMGDAAYQKWAAGERHKAMVAAVEAERLIAQAAVEIEAKKLQAMREGTAEELELARASLLAAEQNVAHIDKLLDELSRRGPKLFEPKFGSKSGKDTLETIKEIQREIDQLNQKGVETFALKLEKGLDSIGKKAKQAGVAAAEVKRLKEEYTKALATSEINEFNKKMRELEGNKTDAVMRQLTVDTNNLSAAMQKVGYSTEEVTAATERLKHLTLTSHRKDVLQEEIAFLKSMETLSNQYGLSTEKQNELIRIQADMYRKCLSPELQKLVDEWVRLKELENDPSWGAGITRAAQKWVEEWTNAGKIAEKQFAVLTSAIDSLGNSVVDSIFDGAEFRADRLFKDMAKQMMKIAMNQMIGGLFGSLFGGPTKSLYASGSVGNNGSVDPGPWKPFSAPTAHRGGIAGAPDTNIRRSVHPSVFNNAPRYHTGGIAGLRSNEVASILLKGEGVFTPAQMARLAPVEAVRPQVNFNVVNHMGDSAQVRTKETPTANGGVNIDVLIEQKVRSGIASGRFNQAMRSQYGLSPMIRGR